jgi:hypothetical protein
MVLDFLFGVALHIGKWGHFGIGWRFGWADLDHEKSPMVRIPTLGLALSSSGWLPKVVDEILEASLGLAIYQFAPMTVAESVGKSTKSEIRHQTLGRFGYGVRARLYQHRTSIGINPGSLFLGAYQDWEFGSGTGVAFAGVGGELTFELASPRIPIAFTACGGYFPSVVGNQWVVGGYLTVWSLWFGGAKTAGGWLAGGSGGAAKKR